jgi:hypothetical protein
MESLSPKDDNSTLRIGRNQARLSREGGFGLEGLMSDTAVRRAKLQMGKAAGSNLIEGVKRTNR